MSQICVGLPLFQRQPHLGVAAHELGDGLRQRVTRLGVGGGDGQRAFRLAGELVADALQVLRLAQDAFRDAQHFLARLGHRDHALAVANEDLDAQLIFQQANLFGNAGLRSMQLFRCFGDIQALFGHFDQIAQLLQFHKTGVFHKTCRH